MKKVLYAFILCLSLLLTNSLYASQLTTQYNLEIPAEGDFDWISIISKDIISIDTVMGIISNDSVVMKEAGLEVFIDGGEVTIVTGDSSAFIEVPYNCSINSASLFIQPSGSMIVDIWKDTYANFPPTVSDSICSTSKLTISSGVASTDSAMAGWTTTLSKGNILLISVDSVTTSTKACVSLKVKKL